MNAITETRRTKSTISNFALSVRRQKKIISKAISFILVWNKPPDPRLMGRHYIQAVKARIRVFLVGMMAANGGNCLDMADFARFSRCTASGRGSSVSSVLYIQRNAASTPPNPHLDYNYSMVADLDLSCPSERCLRSAVRPFSIISIL